MGLLGTKRIPARVTFPRGDALLASAERSTVEKSSQYRRLSQPWQLAAFAKYHTLGECWYATQFYAKALSKLRIFAGRMDEQGEIQESEPDSWEAEQLNRIQDPGGGRTGLLYNYGRLIFLIGETYLIGSEDADGEEGWEFLSSSELRAVPGTKGYVRYGFPGATPEEIPDAPDDDFEPVGGESVVYRFWMPDPEYSRLADSPVRSVLPLLDQIALLEATFNARLKSRLAAAGILLVAQDLSFGSPDGQNDDNPRTDQFAQRLQQAMVAPIANPNAASAVAPIVLEVPSNLIEGGDARGAMAMIRIHDPGEVLPELEQWEKAVKRLAVGLDMPSEILLGMGDATRWSSWQIDDSTWTAHLQPVAQMLVDNLGSAFLRPLARTEGIDYASEIVVGYDPADVINHPDRTKDAQQAYTDGVLSAAKYREVIGFTEDDAPTPQEHEEFVFIKTRGQAQALELQDLADGNVPGGEPTTPIPPESATSETKLQDEEQQVSASAALAERVIGAASIVLDRTRERAGSRLVAAVRNANGGCDGCLDKIKDVPAGLVASALGQEAVEALGLDASALTAGGSDILRTAVARWDVPAEVTHQLSALVEREAARSLFDPQPLPDRISSYVTRALTGRT